jgi:hypothetical protein
MIFPSKFNNSKCAGLKNTDIHMMLSREEQQMIDFVKQCLHIDPT